MKVCVLGAGTMGAGIAQVFIQAGFKVVLRDVTTDHAAAGRARIESNLARLLQKEKITAEQQADALARLTATHELAEAADCDLVVEAAIESLAAKLAIFAELEALCQPATIFASNTSSISISALAAATRRLERVIGMHFFNPVPVMRLVEVIRGIGTSPETYEAVVGVAGRLGKEVVTVEEAPGFVVNRILIPMINEAVGVLADGVATAADIDKAMKLGANHPMGPLALGDLIGLDVCLAIMEILHVEFGEDKYRPHPLLRKLVRGGKLGVKSGEGFHRYPG